MDTNQRQRGISLWTVAALLTSCAGVAGTLYLSIGMDLKACPLCLYQRAFIMGVAGMLLIGMLCCDVNPGRLSLMALPLAAASLGVVGIHEYLWQTGALECPKGVSGILTAPQESLFLHAVLVVFLLFDVKRTGKVVPMLLAVILGGALAYGAFQSSPPPCPPNYDIPLDQDGCRKPRPAN